MLPMTIILVRRRRDSVCTYLDVTDVSENILEIMVLTCLIFCKQWFEQSIVYLHLTNKCAWYGFCTCTYLYYDEVDIVSCNDHYDGNNTIIVIMTATDNDDNDNDDSAATDQGDDVYIPYYNLFHNGRRGSMC